ncbi:MAG: peptidylprolyl isomerase [Candidatus Coatesbacteria bacterium]|nr:peptidylprolyl isomerase [Candidatus Coatesbacteria bacterium]
MQNIEIKIALESGGNIILELYPEIAPKTVSNFLKLIKQNFYDGIIFHRVIPDFMIQAGCPEGTGFGGSQELIFGEFDSNGFSNPLKHTKGVISMARTNEPNSASSQFFIMVADCEHLDGKYASFGKVKKGYEYCENISKVKRDSKDKPFAEQKIKTIRIL